MKAHKAIKTHDEIEAELGITLGRAVNYRGDVANHPGKGRIVAVQTSRWGREFVVSLDDGRSTSVTAGAFAGSYPRFELLEG